jgi:hypothetical protein
MAALADEDCIVWLWTTNAFRHQAFECLETWCLEGTFTLNTKRHTLSGNIGVEDEFLIIGSAPTFCPPAGHSCPSGTDAYCFEAGPCLDEWSTFTITAVPEPAALLPLFTAVGTLSRRLFRVRRRTWTACGSQGRSCQIRR